MTQPDEKQLEDSLRRALRAREPEEGFCDEVLRRVAASGAVPAVPATRSRGPAAAGARVTRWVPAALAASLIAGLGLTYWAQQRQREQIETRAELLEALSLASGYLDSARAVVTRQERGE